jgi:capsular polysaccharide biosynthesis protein
MRSPLTAASEPAPGRKTAGIVAPSDGSPPRKMTSTLEDNYTHLGPLESPPTLGVLESVRLYPWAFVIPIIVLAVLAGVIGFTRQPTYTAETQITVGSPTVSPQAVPGVVQASQALAGSYARAVADADVTRRVAKETGLSQSTVASALTATPVPDSSVVIIDAAAKGLDHAVALANAAATALSAHIAALSNDKATNDALARYRRVAAKAAALQHEVNDLRIHKAAPDKIFTAASKLQATNLQLRTISNLYQVSQAGNLQTAPLKVLAAASSASSDKSSKLQKYLFIGIVAGVVLGLGAALLLANVRARRL